MKNIRGKRATFFGNAKTLARTHNFRIFDVSSVVLILKIIMIIMLFMLATNSIDVKSYLPTTDTDYVLLIDSSPSMAKSDLQPSRLGSAKDISTRWLSVIPNSTAVSVVGFSTTVDYFIPLTNDKLMMQEAIASIEIDYTRSGADLDYALSYSIDLLRNSSQKKAILLFTDGTSNVTDSTIIKAIDEEIKIITFGIGQIDETAVELGDIPEEFLDTFRSLDLNFEMLEDLSKRTGGQAYRVSSEIELERSFEDATYDQVKRSINTAFYVALILIMLSILELIIYAKLGAL
jgi:hypothetical protein